MCSLAFKNTTFGSTFPSALMVSYGLLFCPKILWFFTLFLEFWFVIKCKLFPCSFALETELKQTLC